MMRHGIVEGVDRRFGFVDTATQEEAERLSNNDFQEGIIVFIPLTGASQIHIDEKVERMLDDYKHNDANK